MNDPAHSPQSAASSALLAKQLRACLSEEGILEDHDDLLSILHARGGEEEFAIGKALCASADPLDRITGIRILARPGAPGASPFLKEAAGLIIPLLEDADVRVVDHAASSLGNLRDPRAIPHLVKLEDHPDASVRYSVALGLTGHEDSRAVASLIRLAGDDDRDVRNWAVFSLATQISDDTRRIRQVLFEAMSDEDDEIMGEAMVGLAERGDPRVIKALLQWWKNEPPFGLTLEAAAAIASPELVPPLQKLLQEMDNPASRPDWKQADPDWADTLPGWRDDLVQALEKCRKGRNAP